MSRHPSRTELTEIDLMTIRAGGRTQAELEAMVEGGCGFDAFCGICMFLAGAFSNAVVRLKTGANRATEGSRRRHDVENAFDMQ